MPPTVIRRRLTADEFERLGEVGVLHPDERVELLDGELFQMAPIGSRHAASVSRTDDLFSVRTAGRAMVRVQNPIRLSAHSEPELDIVLVRPRADYYLAAHPTPADVFLTIEVSDTTLDYDRKVKLPLYAAVGIPEVWIAALVEDHIKAYREPVDGRYRERQTFKRGSVLAPLSMPDLFVRCEEILGDVPS